MLNDENKWVDAMTLDSPESEEFVESVQQTIDSILGVGRDNKSIAKIVWNGDIRFWKEIYIDWDINGKPTNLIKRPFVLYKSIFNSHDKFVRDVFVPRYIVLTRLEPEQYVEGWAEQVKFYCPERRMKVPYRPLTPPKDHYVWFKTIAKHNPYCCRKAASFGASCFGQYASPSQFIEEARQIRKGMEFSNLPQNSPFDSPDKIAQKLRDRQTNNYLEQSMRRWNEQASHLLHEDPFSAVAEGMAFSGASIKEIEMQASENLKRQGEMMEKVYSQAEKSLR